MNSAKWIVVSGNCVDGFSFYGPFDYFDDAAKFMEMNDIDGIVTSLSDPEEY